jgi:hypothetical protein
MRGAQNPPSVPKLFIPKHPKEKKEKKEIPGLALFLKG